MDESGIVIQVESRIKFTSSGNSRSTVMNAINMTAMVYGQSVYALRYEWNLRGSLAKRLECIHVQA